MDDKAVLSAQSLVFGPRRSGLEVPASVQKAKKSEMAKMGKKRAKERTKSDYARAFSEAGDEANKGNFAPLAALPTAQHGLKGVEKQSLRLLVSQLSANFSQKIRGTTLASHPRIGEELISNPEDLDSLLALRDKLIAYNVPDKVRTTLGRHIMTQVSASANAQAIGDLIDRSEEIGPLPEAMMGDDYNRHLVKDGKPVCGCEPYDFSRRRNAPVRHSILSDEINCEDCVARKDEADLLPSEQWSEMLSEQSLASMGAYVSNFGYYGDRLGDDSALIISTYQNTINDQINHNLVSAGCPKLL